MEREGALDLSEWAKNELMEMANGKNRVSGGLSVSACLPT